MILIIIIVMNDKLYSAVNTRVLLGRLHTIELNWIELNFIIEVHMCRFESQAYNMH